MASHTNTQSKAGPILLDRENRSIWRNGVEVKLTEQQFLMVAKIADSPQGVSTEALFDHMYGAWNSPACGRHGMYVQRIRANHRLSKISVQITTSHGHGPRQHSTYALSPRMRAVTLTGSYD